MRTIKCFTEKRFFKWYEDERSVSLRERSASYGGGSEVLIVQRVYDPSHRHGTEEPICVESAQVNAGIMRGGCPTLNASHEQPILFGKSNNKNDTTKEQSMTGTSVVRRLTPRECERLQGFPDDWTLIGEPEKVIVRDYNDEFDEDGNITKRTQIGTHEEIEYFYTDVNGKRKKCADSARYKALGNSIAVGYQSGTGFWMWLMERISAQYDRPATLGSLFDGIGGFPLAWEHYNGKGSAAWASEIEPFCIEVTRRRFPEGGEMIDG